MIAWSMMAAVCALPRRICIYGSTIVPTSLVYPVSGNQRRSSMVKPIPEGYHSVTPYLILNHASDAIAFYQVAFGAHEVMRMDDPGGRIHHAEISIGDSRIMLADEHPEIQALSPKTIGGSPVSLHLYVEDVDAAAERALAAGAKLVRPIAEQFYGDRVGGIEDPFGYRWFLASHKEDLTMDEIRRRAAAQSS
jgi:PhnB protein